MHGDLKAGNVLLQNLHGGCDQIAKISDFGLATVLMDGATHRSTASMGTITHMAPEVLKSGRMSLAADVYSFAIMSELPLSMLFFHWCALLVSGAACSFTLHTGDCLFHAFCLCPLHCVYNAWPLQAHGDRQHVD